MTDSRIDSLEKVSRNINVEYQVTITRHGRLLVKTEWTKDLDAVCDVTDAVNHCRELSGRGYRAVVATRGV